jgi:hypothetical protein
VTCAHCSKPIDPPPAKTSLPVICTADCMIAWEKAAYDAMLRAPPKPDALVDLWRREESGEPVRRIIIPEGSDT